MAGVTTFTLARFERSRVPALLAGVPGERLRLRRLPGLDWGRHLGTSMGSHTLGVDPARWAWICRWDDEGAARRFHADIESRLGPVEVATLSLRTLRARGRWAGHEVPAPPSGADDPAPDGPLVVLTRARVRPRSWRSFTRAIPLVDADLQVSAGRLRSIGVGEWPILVQATLSIWKDAAAMTAFSRTEAHRTAIRRTAEERWYAEDLFARFAIDGVQGTWDGAPPLDPAARGGR